MVLAKCDTLAQKKDWECNILVSISTYFLCAVKSSLLKSIDLVFFSLQKVSLFKQ